MRRRIARPFGATIPASRVLSMLVSLAVLWVLYDTARQSASWRWLELQAEDAPQQAAPIAGTPAVEVIVPGANDLDPAEWAKFHELGELITDRRELRGREMMAYWQLVRWSRTQSMADLEKRAQHEPALTQIWEEPQKYRGKLLRLRMHVRRVLKHEDSKNPLGLADVYEAMGWTDESKSVPYTIIFTELPPGLPVGKSVEAEVVFVGYFLKVMAYQTFDDKSRGTPLLLGRARLVAPRNAQVSSASTGRELAVIAIGGLLLTGAAVWVFSRGNRPKSTPRSNAVPIDPQWVPFGSDAGVSQDEVAIGPTIPSHRPEGL